MKRTVLPLFAPLAFMLWTGCMKLGPDYRRPDGQIPIPAAYEQEEQPGSPFQADDRWWEAFQDPELNRLVAEVAEHNLDIKKASARILEVGAQLVQVRSERYPQLALQGAASRQQRTGVTNSTNTVSVPAAFELDLWGRLARQEEASRASLLSAEENRRTVIHTVIAEAVTLYLQMENLERALQIASDTVESYRHSLRVVEGRYLRGLTPVLDLRQARRTLARTEATLPALRQELGTVQQKIAVLSGRYPETRPARSQPEAYFQRMAPIPPGLPSELLLRRPDIRDAEARLVALNAQVGAAKASRFPAISLTGSFGYSSEQLHRLFTPESELWSIAAGLLQPLFDGGRRKAAQQAAEARYQQGVAEYAKIVLNAFAEVERALLARKTQLERRDRIVLFLEEARASQEIAEDRYRRGLADYLTVLVAQQVRFGAEEDLLSVDLAILANRVTLHRALGGGWGEHHENSKGHLS